MCLCVADRPLPDRCSEGVFERGKFNGTFHFVLKIRNGVEIMSEVGWLNDAVEEES
jgi:hypothetical protein